MNNPNHPENRSSPVARARNPCLVLLLCWFTGACVAHAMDIVDHGQRKVPKSGKKNIFQRRLDLNTGVITYGLNIRMIKEKDGLRVTGIGMTSDQGFWRPCKRGWSSSSFIKVDIAGKDLFSHPCRIVLTDREARLVFRTLKGDVTLFFAGAAQVDHLYLGLQLPRAAGKARIDFIAHPAEFARVMAQNGQTPERCFATATRQVRQGSDRKVSPRNSAVKPVLLDTAKESWVYYYDAGVNPANQTQQANCSLLFVPRQVESVEVRATRFAILTTVKLKPGVRTSHFVLWDFPGKDREAGLRYMRSLAVSYARPGQ